MCNEKITHTNLVKATENFRAVRPLNSTTLTPSLERRETMKNELRGSQVLSHAAGQFCSGRRVHRGIVREVLFEARNIGAGRFSGKRGLRNIICALGVFLALPFASPAQTIVNSGVVEPFGASVVGVCSGMTIWHNLQTGDVWADDPEDLLSVGHIQFGKAPLGWTTAGTGTGSSAWGTGTSLVPKVKSGCGDFNLDGMPDVFWFNPTTGETSVWLMSPLTFKERNVAVTSPTYMSLPNVSPSSGWLPIGVGDFNGDRIADVFWWNQTTGDTSVWLMNGTNAPTIVDYGIKMSPLSYSIVGFGDVDEDGKTDVFWWNVNGNGQTLAWLMHGANNPTTQTYYSVARASSWIPWGLGDFDGNGKADVFWWNPVTQQTSAWLMNGTNNPQNVNYDPVPDSSGWFPAGIGWLNHSDTSQKADVLWLNCNSSTCTTSVWLMK